MQVIGEDTTKVVVTPVVINDTLPKIKPFNGDDKDAIKIKLEIKDNMMYIRPKVNGIEMRFLLDTGCHDIHLTPIEVLFMEHQGIFDSKKAIGTEKCIYADGQEHECAVYMLNSVELGGIKIDSVKFTTDPNGGSPDDTPLFGQKVLNRFGDIMINYGDSTLIIKKKNVK
jgi:predicted aspartyl protease